MISIEKEEKKSILNIIKIILIVLSGFILYIFMTTNVSNNSITYIFDKQKAFVSFAVVGISILLYLYFTYKNNKKHIYSELEKEFLKKIEKYENNESRANPTINNAIMGGAIMEILNDAIRDAPLDYVAYYHYNDNTKKAILEELYSPNMENRIKECITSQQNQDTTKDILIDREQRGKLYRKIALGLHKTIDQLNDEFESLEEDILLRIVFDVKYGGYFFYHIDDNEYVFGATVCQKEMDNNEADLFMNIIQESIHEAKKSWNSVQPLSQQF